MDIPERRTAADTTMIDLTAARRQIAALEVGCREEKTQGAFLAALVAIAEAAQVSMGDLADVAVSAEKATAAIGGYCDAR